MQRSDFHYELPPELIAQVPLAERRASRLLVLDGATGARRGSACSPSCRSCCAPAICSSSTTRACCRRACWRASRRAGASSCCSSACSGRAARSCICARATSRRRAATIELPGGARARVVARAGELTEVELDRDVVPFLEAHGETPLPPYIARTPDAADRERYQTVFARAPGAVAAPTAGLHFDARAARRARGARRRARVLDAARRRRHVRARAARSASRTTSCTRNGSRFPRTRAPPSSAAARAAAASSRSARRACARSRPRRAAASSRRSPATAGSSSILASSSAWSMRWSRTSTCPSRRC